MKKHSHHNFEIQKVRIIKETTTVAYGYRIQTAICKPYTNGIIESHELYDTEQEARFAAVGHITLLENEEA